MKKFTCSGFCLFFCISLFAQPHNKAAADAFLITRMIEKFHVQPRQLNDGLSSDLFKNVLRKLDEDRILFTLEDLAKLNSYEFQLDDEVRQKKTGFLQLVTNVFSQRITQVDTMIDNISKKPFTFSLPDKLTAKDDTSFAINDATLRLKLYKQLKLDVLNSLVELNDQLSTLSPAKQKQSLDSAEVVFRKKAALSYKRFINQWQQNPGGIAQAVSEVYCEALALCYDPHTAYFPPAKKENFEGMLGGDRFQFGFQLSDEEDEGVVIQNLKPGSPAFKSGMLNKGDKLQSLQWEGQKPIDVSDASKEEVSQILSASNRDRMIMTIKKADGTLRELTLQKEKATDDGEDSRVRSFILKGGKNIGYISIPAFYTDWSENAHDENGCANDVAKEIVKLKKEKIDGLIVDVRFNGGGSMEEAIQLSGIFIDAGPVGQFKTHEGKVYTLKDANRGTIYDGPLMIMINGYSASASEMIAGTLQDYNRALIVGTPSYGKATAQVVLPMDTTFDGTKKLTQHGSASFIKVTNGTLYRINGTTAQGKGVIPDVILPDFSETDNQKEANEVNTLKVAAIDANKYYKPLQPLPAASLKSLAEEKMLGSEYFKAVHQYKKMYNNINKAIDFSLVWSDALKEKKKQSEAFDIEKIKSETNAVFTINNNLFETQRLATDESLRQANEQIKSVLKNDAQLKVAYELILQLSK